MWSNRGILFRFIGFLSEHGICTGKRITVDKAMKLIDGFELSQWSPLDDCEKEKLRRRLAKRESNNE